MLAEAAGPEEVLAVEALFEVVEHSDDDQCYRAIDWLTEIEAELAEQVYWSVGILFNLEVDLLYQAKKSWQKARASSIEPNRSGKPGRYLSVLNWASEYGLSSD